MMVWLKGVRSTRARENTFNVHILNGATAHVFSVSNVLGILRARPEETVFRR